MSAPWVTNPTNIWQTPTGFHNTSSHLGLGAVFVKPRWGFRTRDSLSSQGALRDPGLCCGTPSEFKTYDATMIKASESGSTEFENKRCLKNWRPDRRKTERTNSLNSRNYAITRIDEQKDNPAGLEKPPQITLASQDKKSYTPQPL